MKKAADVIENVINVFVIILLILITIVMTVNVVGRFLQPYMVDGINIQITWAEEFVKLAMLWMVWLVSSVIIVNKGHFALHFLTRKYPHLKLLSLIQFAATIILGLLLMYYGTKVSLELSILKTPSLQISKMVVYLVVPLGGLLMIFFQFAAIEKRDSRNQR